MGVDPSSSWRAARPVAVAADAVGGLSCAVWNHHGTERACPHLPEGEGAKARSFSWDAGLPSCAVRPGTATSDTSPPR